jgi:UDP-N-acetylmuramyl pentapeptide phosphotransferase/UDP-N-acetylglucosamine-1-phosphate transferase
MTGPIQLTQSPLLTAAIPIVSALLCIALIIALRPLLERYALARPNARSSHSRPTPQGGGIAIVAATIAAIAIFGFAAGHVADASAITFVLAAAVCLAAVGAIDDLWPIPVLPRLVLQIAAVAAVLVTLPAELRIAPILPFWFERIVLLIAVLWFVNLTNFMDGLDWMTVAEILPITTALATFGFAGWVSADSLLVALSLAGALIGFAPFNRPVAKLFMGDVGSLPIGLLTAWCLVLLAGDGHIVAALLLPLYYLADATLTLVMRLGRREKVWVAHRSHFYQRATDNGYKVIQVVRDVFILNLILACLAAGSIAFASPAAGVLSLTAGGIAVIFLLVRFSRYRGC